MQIPLQRNSWGHLEIRFRLHQSWGVSRKKAPILTHDPEPDEVATDGQDTLAELEMLMRPG